MSVNSGWVQRLVTIFIAALTVAGLLYWATGKHELGTSNYFELRSRIKSTTVDPAERASLLRVQDVYAANEGLQKRMVAPASENMKRNHEISGDMVERIYVNLMAINAGLAAGMALLVVLRRNVSAAGGFFALGMSCFAFPLCWLLVSGQAPGRWFLPEVPVEIYYAGHVLVVVCWGCCIVAMDGFFIRFPRRLSSDDIYEALANPEKALSRSHPINRFFVGFSQIAPE